MDTLAKSQPLPHHPTISISSSKLKLPIKRKTSSSDSSPTPPVPTHPVIDGFDPHTPFKFHRIWTERDEIRFLRGLLDSASQGLSFPRDLPLFYARFAQTMSRPFTKPQLSEKLRRLRKKFRLISARLAGGLDLSLLSPHDRALFEISSRLWSPQYAASSPFGNHTICVPSPADTNGKLECNLVGIKVNFSPTLPFTQTQIHDHRVSDVENGTEENENGVDGRRTGGIGDGDVRVGYDFEGVAGVTGKTVLKVFDEFLKEVRMALDHHNERCAGSSDSKFCKERKVVDFEKRWQEQRAAELDVLCRRLRLVIEDSLHGQ